MKLASFFQTTFSKTTFLDEKKYEKKYVANWVQLTIYTHCFLWWLVSGQVINHYPNQKYPNSPTLIRVIHDDVIKWNIFRVTGPLCGEFTGPGEFPTQRPVTRSFDVFFDLRLNKRLSTQSWGWWFETLSRPLWHYRNVWNNKFPCPTPIASDLHSINTCRFRNSWLRSK